MEFRLALQAARKRAKLTQDQLAESLGVSRNAVTNWEAGNNYPETSTLTQLAHVLNIRVGALFDDLPPQAYADRRSRYDVSSPSVYPPVVGTAQLGSDGFWLELEFPTGRGDGFVRYPSRDANAYALRCKGDSMRPRIKPGEFVVVEPNHGYSPGDEVVIKDKSGRVMVKVFNFQRNGTIELSSVNEDHKPLTLDLADIEHIHYIAAICKSSMYYKDIA